MIKTDNFLIEYKNGCVLYHIMEDTNYIPDKIVKDDKNGNRTRSAAKA
jgi:hypothetical protein